MANPTINPTPDETAKAVLASLKEISNRLEFIGTTLNKPEKRKDSMATISHMGDNSISGGPDSSDGIPPRGLLIFLREVESALYAGDKVVIHHADNGNSTWYQRGDERGIVVEGLDSTGATVQVSMGKLHSQ